MEMHTNYSRIQLVARHVGGVHGIVVASSSIEAEGGRAVGSEQKSCLPAGSRD